MMAAHFRTDFRVLKKFAYLYARAFVVISSPLSTLNRTLIPNDYGAGVPKRYSVNATRSARAFKTKRLQF